MLLLQVKRLLAFNSWPDDMPEMSPTGAGRGGYRMRKRKAFTQKQKEEMRRIIKSIERVKFDAIKKSEGKQNESND